MPTPTPIFIPVPTSEKDLHLYLYLWRTLICYDETLENSNPKRVWRNPHNWQKSAGWWRLSPTHLMRFAAARSIILCVQMSGHFLPLRHTLHVCRELALWDFIIYMFICAYMCFRCTWQCRTYNHIVYMYAKVCNRRRTFQCVYICDHYLSSNCLQNCCSNWFCWIVPELIWKHVCKWHNVGVDRDNVCFCVFMKY